MAVLRVKEGQHGLLQDLAIEFERASITLRATGYIGQDNNSITIRQLGSKLPSHSQRRWIERNDRIERHDREVTFDDLVAFVAKEAARSQTISAWAPIQVASPDSVPW